jgi:hypothetical protein
LVAQAEGWGIGDSIEPHAAGPDRDAVEEGSGLVGGPKGQKLCVTGCVEGTADMRRQLSELGGGSLGEAICGSCAMIGEVAVHVAPCVDCDADGGSTEVQFRGGCGEVVALREAEETKVAAQASRGRLAMPKPPSLSRK